MWCRIFLPLFGCLLLCRTGSTLLSFDDLRECYNDSTVYTKENLLPMTITTLISLIQKAENYPSNQNFNINPMTSALLTRFRLDGIERNPGLDLSSTIIPFGTTGSEYNLYSLLFNNIFPVNMPQNGLDNSTFTRIERCSLHSMLSSSVDKWQLNGVTCDSLTKSWSSRIPRSIEKDAEVFDPKTGPSSAETGSYQQSLAQDIDHQLSQCPLENGVIYTDSGTVNPGLVLAGIAAGFSPQSINVNNLRFVDPGVSIRRRPPPPGPSFKPDNVPPYNRRRGGDPGFSFARGGDPSYGFSPQNDYDTIDSRWAATIAGLLAEVTLTQGPYYLEKQGGYNMGSEGNWNDTTIPKYYFLSNPVNLQATAARMRGSFDGKYMASNIQTWYNGRSGIRLSQILDMYYSQNGVFSPTNKACNRASLSGIISSPDMAPQTHAMAKALRKYQPSVTFQENAMLEASHGAASIFDSTFNSLSSGGTQCSVLQPTPVSTPVADLHFILDMSWDYQTIKRILYAITDKLLWVPVGGSNITLIRGYDGTVLIDSASSVLDFYQNFTQNLYQSGSMAGGANMLSVMTRLQQICAKKLHWENVVGTNTGGPPRVALFILKSVGTMSNTNFDMLNFTVGCPDFHLLFFIQGSKDGIPNRYVVNKDKDVMIYTNTGAGDFRTAVAPVLKRISQVPRRIINPACGMSWNPQGRTTNLQLNGYLGRNEIQYYRVSSNYFYHGSSAKITVSSDSAVVNVCTSQYNSNPTGNSSGVTCGQVLPGRPFNIDASSSTLCSGHSYAINCPPLYISVSTTQNSQVPSGTTTNFCSDPGCRFADMIKVVITQQGLTCYSGVSILTSSPILLLIVILGYLFN